jgi:hypothetical protein
MKIFKTIDVLIQISILFAIAINYWVREGGGDDAAMICVVGFGAWQVLSSLIHFFLKIKKTWWRFAYSIAGVLILFLLLAIKLDFFSEDDFIDVMLVLAPTMGVYYFILSCIETVELYNRKKIENSFTID